MSNPEEAVIAGLALPIELEEPKKEELKESSKEKEEEVRPTPK